MEEKKKQGIDENVEETPTIDENLETKVDDVPVEENVEEKPQVDKETAETKVETETTEAKSEDKPERPDETRYGAGKLVVAHQPDNMKYRAGERISLSGLAITFDGVDVTNECVMSVKEGTPFPIDERRLDVEVKHEPSGKTITITLKRKRKLLIPILIGLLVAALVGAGVWMFTHPAEQKFPEGETGSYIIPKGNMSDEDAQKMLDEMTEKSRITVSIAPDMKLKDNGDLRVNLVVPEGNNGLSERLEIEQDGRVVYRSGVVSPGHVLEWGSNSSAHTGTATATIYAIQSDADFGNPVSVEVNIVAE